jgi:hypothetical protein
VPVLGVGSLVSVLRCRFSGVGSLVPVLWSRRDSILDGNFGEEVQGFGRRRRSGPAAGTAAR